MNCHPFSPHHHNCNPHPHILYHQHITPRYYSCYTDIEVFYTQSFKCNLVLTSCVNSTQSLHGDELTRMYACLSDTGGAMDASTGSGRFPSKLPSRSTSFSLPLKSWCDSYGLEESTEGPNSVARKTCLLIKYAISCFSAFGKTMTSQIWNSNHILRPILPRQKRYRFPMAPATHGGHR